MGDNFNVTVTRVISQAASRVGAVMDQAFNEAFSVFDDAFDSKNAAIGVRTSKVTKETVDGVRRVVLEVEVAGCGKSDVDITAAGNMITASWKAKIDGNNRSCQFSVGQRADLDSVSAKLENGYLTIVVLEKKVAKDEPKKVRVD